MNIKTKKNTLKIFFPFLPRKNYQYNRRDGLKMRCLTNNSRSLTSSAINNQELIIN